MRILIIEDESKTAAYLSDGLKGSGYIVNIANDGKEGLFFASEHEYDLIILDVLDRNVKKPHENPSIGILICKTKDEEVVKYALNRNMSPTMISEYETKFINKAKLQKKLHELSLSLDSIIDT